METDELRYDIPKIPTYEVIEAKDRQEAISKSSFFIGQKAHVAKIRVVPAGREKGKVKWSVFVDFMLEEHKE